MGLPRPAAVGPRHSTAVAVAGPRHPGVVAVVMRLRRLGAVVMARLRRSAVAGVAGLRRPAAVAGEVAVGPRRLAGEVGEAAVVVGLGRRVVGVHRELAAHRVRAVPLPPISRPGPLVGPRSRRRR